MMPISSFHAERRSAERFLVSLPVQTDRGPGITRNVSMSGLYLVIKELLHVGDRLKLIMSIPDPDHPEGPLTLQVTSGARVVRVEECPGVPGAGLALDEDSWQLARAL